VRLRLSTDAIRTIDRIGVDAAVAQIRARGGKV
jgi:large subunit ribosomal protein L28